MSLDETNWSPIVKSLYEEIHSMANEGIEINFKNLSSRSPNHSKRDYHKALDIYKDEQARIQNNAFVMPDNLKKRIDGYMLLCWSYQSNYFENLLSAEKKSMNDSIQDARTARDKAIEENEKLVAICENQKNKLAAINNTKEEYEKKIKSQEVIIRELEIANARLVEKTKAQDESIRNLKEVVDKINR